MPTTNICKLSRKASFFSQFSEFSVTRGLIPLTRRQQTDQTLAGSEGTGWILTCVWPSVPQTSISWWLLLKENVGKLFWIGGSHYQNTMSRWGNSFMHLILYEWKNTNRLWPALEWPCTYRFLLLSRLDKSPRRTTVFWQLALPAIRIPEQSMHLSGCRCCLTRNYPTGSVDKSQLNSHFLLNGVMLTGHTLQKSTECWAGHCKVMPHQFNLPMPLFIMNSLFDNWGTLKLKVTKWNRF